MATSAAPRTPRAWRHEQELLDAAFAELIDAGWAGIVPARVAARAGRSITPVRTRFGDRSGIAVALWETRVAAPLLESLTAVTSALDSPSNDLPRRLEMSLLPFLRPDDALQAAVELLVASSYDPALAAAVRYALDGEIDRWLTPHPRGTTPTAAAQRATVLSIALGLTALAPVVMGRSVDISIQAAYLANALMAPSRPAALPSGGAEHLDLGFVFDSGDPITDAVLRATLETVGEIGYEAATVERIARRSGFTQGAIFSRYQTKAAMFLDATRRDTAAASLRNTAMMERIAKRRSIGIAEAFFIRESMSQGRGIHRVVLLEQLRLSRTNAEIAAALDNAVAPIRAQVEQTVEGTPAQKTGELHISLARGNGPALLAVIAPTAWSLPFDVVAVPLHAADS
jgi:AcrR family transcriptional regulator